MREFSINKFMSLFHWEKSFIKLVFTLALPSALQNLVSASLHIVDNIMIGFCGEVELAAVSQANRVVFVLQLFLFGISAGVTIFSAQFWGNKDIKSIKQVQGLGLIAACAISLFFTLVAWIFPDQILSLFLKGESAKELAVQYLSITALGYIFSAINIVISSVLRSTEKVKLPMYASIAAILVNSFFNYCLIFGNFGFPRMGVSGAAIATVLASIVNVIILILFSKAQKLVPYAKLSEMIPTNWSFVKSFFKVSLPVIFNEGLWGLGTTVYAMVYGTMGEGVLAAVSLFSTVEYLATVFVHGVVAASCVIVGKTIGERQMEKAYVYGKRLLLLGSGIALLMGLVMILGRNLITLPYNISAHSKYLAQMLILVCGFMLVFKSFNFICVVGVLRSGGDTIFSFLLDIGSIWLVGVPLACVGAAFKMPVYYVYLLICCEEVFKFTLGLRRFIGKKWMNDLTYIAKENLSV